MLTFLEIMSGEAIGGEMGRSRTLRFLLKLPNDERDGVRLWIVMGDGLVCLWGEVVKVRAGDLVPVRGTGGDDG